MNPSGASALTTPYTGQWAPLLHPGLDAAALAGLGQAMGRHWRGAALTRLDALDGGSPWLPDLLRGAARAGLVPLRFDHFGNWHLDVGGQSWETYLAGRPGELRSTIRRHSKRVMDRLGASLALVTGADGLEDAVADYERVYAASWKEPEPFPAFNPALMREAARQGGLRLGVLHLDGRPIAAQFWLVHGAWAGVQKLAHDEEQRQLAPGTVLTALMIRHLLEVDRVRELDFGRGDDPYKALWTGARRQRVGVVLASLWPPSGAMAIARHGLGRWRRLLVGGLPNAAKSLTG